MPVAASPAAPAKSTASRDNARIYSIAELAREFGITARTMRFYEDEGLIKPRRQGLTRLYSAHDRMRLSWILRGKRLGFSLRDISDYLSLYDADRTQRAQVSLLVDMVNERMRMLEVQLGDLQTTLGELREIKKLASERLAQAS